MDELKEIHSLVAELRKKFEDHEKGIYTKAEFAEFEAKINKRIDELELKLARPGLPAGESQEKKAFIEWCRKGTVAPEQAKALSLASDSGGALAPKDFVAEVIKGQVEFSPVRALARVRPISSTSTDIPKRTGVSAASWVAETGNRADAPGLAYGTVNVPAHELSCLVLLSKQLLEDSVFDLEAELRTEFAEQFGVAEGAAFVAGDGAGKPMGLLTATGVASVDSAAVGEVDADTLIELCYTLPEPYARNASWLMKRSTLGAIRKLKDTSGQYLWQPAVAAGQPSTLLGYPVFEAKDMPAVAAGAYPIVFGDIRQAYLIVDRVQLEVQRLVELYAGTGQVGFLGRKRVGGMVVLPEAIVKYHVKAV